MDRTKEYLPLLDSDLGPTSPHKKFLIRSIVRVDDNPSVVGLTSTFLSGQQKETSETWKQGALILCGVAVTLALIATLIGIFALEQGKSHG
mmetsp:Transcript_6457/g.9451  ORF Transcript_6457/g.9451 Transcript_6457/m.9451 type:complete len:91 (+) Transcript_6457:170-442(+)